MNGKTLAGIIIGLILLVAIGAITFYAVEDTENEDTTQEIETTTSDTSGTSSSSDSSTSSSTDTNTTNTATTTPSEENNVDESTASEPGTYVEYDEALLANAEDGDVVLFFHASWCPTCKTADSEFLSRADEIPTDLTILKTDYDTESGLKNTYNVSYQHTFVQVDADGNELRQWSGGGLDTLLTQISLTQ